LEAGSQAMQCIWPPCKVLSTVAVVVPLPGGSFYVVPLLVHTSAESFVYSSAFIVNQLWVMYCVVGFSSHLPWECIGGWRPRTSLGVLPPWQL
jgi:hypothetical protein